MSHTLINLSALSISKDKSKGFVKPKKGVKVKCIIDRHEGDDDDGLQARLLTISNVKAQGDYYHIVFDEVKADEPTSLFIDFYIKKEK